MSRQQHYDIQWIIENATECAKSMNHKYVSAEHLALSLINFKNFKNFLQDFGCDWKALNDELAFNLSKQDLGVLNRDDDEDNTPTQTKGFIQVTHNATQSAARAKRDKIEPIDIFIAIANEERLYACHLFQKYGILDDDILDFYKKNYDYDDTEAKDQVEQKKALQHLNEYTKNLNKLAKDGKIDPLIGRYKEVEDLCQTLCKRNKSNVLMVGDPGVGKTAIAEGLANRIVKGDVPDFLKNSEIFSLDIASVLSGCNFRGEFEDRIRNIFKGLQSKPGSIVFIDEAHTMRGAGGGAGGGVDFAQMIKPYITKGVKVIASTTWEEYNQSFEKDRALARRFYRLSIDEPTPDVAKDVVKGLKKHFEEHHTATITDEAIDVAVDLSVRHQTDKRLPDKAIDLIDGACAKQRVINKSDFTIEKRHITHELSRIIGVPVDQLGNEIDDTKQNNSLNKIQKSIKNRLFGQDDAVDTVMDKIIVSRAGLKELNKPIGSYLMVGPTGTGKTELAKLLAKNMHMKMIRFDMGEYQEKHTISRLIGAPPGYVGYDDGNMSGGMLISQIQKNPNAVLLFDEIEKAHPDISNILLSLMDEGFVTSSNGQKADARNCIVLMSSNLGATASEKHGVGFGASETNMEANTEAVKSHFPPEFRNRLDGVIKFNKLDEKIMKKIVCKFIEEVNELLVAKGLHINISDTAINELAKIGYDPLMGARPIKRVIEEKIKIPLSKAIIKDRPKSGTEIVLGFKNKKFVFDFKDDIAADMESLEKVTAKVES